tara:strand:- start:84 stop:743 length:660 start_codon:yes stop_codon:yes gene_type:complete
MFYFFCQKISYIFLTFFRIFKYLLSDTKRYANLLFIILAHKPKSIVEIGIYRGTRSKEMIQAAKIFNKDIEFYGFDLFEMINQKILKRELSKFPNSKKNVEKDLSKISKVKLFKGYSFKTLPKIKNKKIDFIFIDGGHAVETIKKDWQNCKILIKKGSIVIFDDYYIGDNKIINKYGCNKIIKSISKKFFEKKLCKFTDNFMNNGKKLRIKMFYLKKIN